VKRFGWWTMALLSWSISLYAIAVLFVPGFGAPIVSRMRTDTPLAFWAHLGGSWLALAAGPLQLNGRVRSRALGFHRWLGRAYVIAVLVGGTGGLVLAPFSSEGIVTHLGFGGLAVVWLFCTIRGYLSIRRGDDVAHRAWMIRSFALTLAAVTLRIILPLELASGVPFPTAYKIVSWACWVPNVIVAEWIVQRGAARPQGSVEPA
jgi:uncharacterized membrane protein